MVRPITVTSSMRKKLTKLGVRTSRVTLIYREWFEADRVKYPIARSLLIG